MDCCLLIQDGVGGRGIKKKKSCSPPGPKLQKKKEKGLRRRRKMAPQRLIHREAHQIDFLRPHVGSAENSVL